MIKSRSLCCYLVALISSAAPSANAQGVSGLAAVRVASGINQPLFVTAPPNDFNRLFIVSKGGQISILNLASGTVSSTLFLNISSKVLSTNERGLLGMAFDPQFGTNGKFYLNFIVAGGALNNGKTRISQFSLGGTGNGDANSEKILLTFDQLLGDHNGGWIGFSPRPNDDHNLYITTGDGGCCNDQGTGHVTGGNGQSLGTLLGKVLRIHVDPVAGTYSIPQDNPFLETPGAMPENWAFGLRNPFRASFDRGTGRLLIGDVGQSTREEIDAQQPDNPGGGENFEWRLREGTVATPTGNPAVGGDRPPNGVDPIFDYPRTTGGSIIGGYVYRGKQIPSLTGKYVFGDYVTHKIFALNYDGGPAASGLQDITSQLFPTATGNFTLSSPSSLGEDGNGELYICDIINGSVFKIVPVTPNVSISSLTKTGPGTQMIINGIGVPFTNVTVESGANLGQQFGSPVVAAVGADGMFQFTDNAGPERKFYRVRYP